MISRREQRQETAQDHLIDRLNSLIQEHQFSTLDKLLNMCVRYSNRLHKENEHLDDSDDEFNEQFDTRYKKVKSLRDAALNALANEVLISAAEFLSKIEEKEGIQLICANKQLGETIQSKSAERLENSQIKPVYATFSNSSSTVEIANYDREANVDSGCGDENFEGSDDQCEEERPLNPAQIIANMEQELDALIPQAPEPVTGIEVHGVCLEPFSFRLGLISPASETPATDFQVELYKKEEKKAVKVNEFNLKQPIFDVIISDKHAIYEFVIRSKRGEEWCMQESIFAFLPHLATTNYKEYIVRTDANDQVCEENPLFKFVSLDFQEDDRSPEIFGIEAVDSAPETLFADIIVGRNVVAVTPAGDLFEWGHMVQFKDQIDIEKNTPVDDPTIIEEGSYESPTSLLPSEKIIQIAAGYDSTLALSVFGAVFGWGLNDVGQLGDGTGKLRVYPAKVSDLPPVRLISAKANNCLAVDIHENMYVWGEDQGPYALLSQPGSKLELARLNPLHSNQFTPRKIESRVGPIKKIEAGVRFNVVLTHSGNLYNWGTNLNWELGFEKPDGSALNYCDLPHRVNKPESFVTDVSVGSMHTVFQIQHSDGKKEIFAFGLNDEGQCGYAPNSNHHGHEPAPCEVQNATKFWAVGESTVFLCGNQQIVRGAKNRAFSFFSATADVRFKDESLISILRA